jgi:nucleotide-binding universal stress UspA family protein
MKRLLGRPIVVGVDGSPAAESAAEYAAWEAERRRIPLRLVYGYQPMPLWGPTLIAADDDRATLTWARDMVATMAHRLSTRHPDIPQIRHDVIAGMPAGVLVDESARATMLVVGPYGAGGFLGRVLGSVATQVAAHAKAPVVVVRPGRAQIAVDEGPIIVGVDGSPGATHALDFAFDEASQRGVPLVAVYVWDVLPLRNLGPVTPWHFDIDQTQSEADRLLAEALAGWQEKYPDVEVERVAVHGFNPANTLVEFGATAGMIVVGTRGHGGFTGLIIGSVSSDLVRQATRTVAIVHDQSR